MLKRTAILAPLLFSAHVSAQTWIEDAQGQRYLLGDQLVSTTTEAYNYCSSKGAYSCQRCSNEARFTAGKSHSGLCQRRG